MKLISFLIFVISSLSANAQEVLTLSINDAIRIAQDSSTIARQALKDYQAEKFQHKAYLSSRKWQMDLVIAPEYEYSTFSPEAYKAYAGARTNSLSAGATLMADQLIGRTGGHVYATSNYAWSEFLGDTGEEYALYTGGTRMFNITPLRVGYRQDLIGFNSSKWEKQIYDQQLITAERKYASQMAKVTETVAAYFFDYASKCAIVDMYETNSITADSLYKIGQEKYAITAIRKDELISLQLSLLNVQNTLRSARLQKERARQSLLSFLAINENPNISLNVILPPEPEQMLMIDPAEALQMAEKYNPAYSNADALILQAEREVAKTRHEKGLQVNLDVSVGIQQYDTKISSAISRLNQPYTVGSVTVSIPLVDHGMRQNKHLAANERLTSSKMDKQEMIRTIKESIVNTINEFHAQQILLGETKKAMLLADESFEQNQYNYAQGISDINTFTLAQNRKDEAHNNYIDALSAFWMSYYQLSTLTLYDFFQKKPL